MITETLLTMSGEKETLIDLAHALAPLRYLERAIQFSYFRRGLDSRTGFDFDDIYRNEAFIEAAITYVKKSSSQFRHARVISFFEQYLPRTKASLRIWQNFVREEAEHLNSNSLIKEQVAVSIFSLLKEVESSKGAPDSWTRQALEAREDCIRFVLSSHDWFSTRSGDTLSNEIYYAELYTYLRNIDFRPVSSSIGNFIAADTNQHRIPKVISIGLVEMVS